MLRDASQKQTIQKFSFIESLTLPKNTKPKHKETWEAIDVGQAFNFVPHTSHKSSVSNKEKAASTISQADYALVTAVKAANLANNSNLAANNSYPGIEEIVKYSALNYPPPKQQKNPQYLGKILFALASSYCLFVLWWLFGHQGTKFITHMMGGRYIALSQSDAEFIDYVERSLVTLDRKVEAQKSKSDQENKVVYVPVYTPKTSKPSIPSPVAFAKPQPLTPQTTSSAPQTLKIPAPPPLPTPTPISRNNAVSRVSPSTSSIKTQAAIRHTLMGILDLGIGKSAALIKVNGQTRRFWIGEEINNSGWILDSISSQSAKINNQGQVRSISVGETF